MTHLALDRFDGRRSVIYFASDDLPAKRSRAHRHLPLENRVSIRDSQRAKAPWMMLLELLPLRLCSPVDISPGFDRPMSQLAMMSSLLPRYAPTRRACSRLTMPLPSQTARDFVFAMRGWRFRRR